MEQISNGAKIEWSKIKWISVCTAGASQQMKWLPWIAPAAGQEQISLGLHLRLGDWSISLYAIAHVDTLL
jgi:hypothetical protein